MHSSIELKRTKSEVIPQDEESRKRGKRMMGMLLGTLSKFRHETENKSEAERKREQIDQRLCEKRLLDKEEQARITEKERLEMREKMEVQRKEVEAACMAEIAETTAEYQKLHSQFKKTSSTPSLFYKPNKEL